MKATKIFIPGKLLCFILWMGISACLFTSCDMVERDADVLSPETHVDRTEVFAVTNNATFIDLASRIKTNQPVTFAVTGSVKHGKLSDLGKGLLQYSPASGGKQIRDAFEFTVYSSKQEVLDVDTVVIIVEPDTTHIPCGIYAMNDYRFGVKPGDKIMVDVLGNDFICGYDSTGLVVEVYQPDNTFPPYAGSAQVSAQVIAYTAGSAFQSEDKVIYRTYPQGHPEVAAYGVLYISGASLCSNLPADDYFTVKKDTIASGLTLRVFDNDSICHPRINFSVSLTENPQHGYVNVGSEVFTYYLTNAAAISDAFRYQICVNDVCRTAKVVIDFTDSIPCVLAAVKDSVTFLPGPTATYISFESLVDNDELCDGIDTVRMTTAPKYAVYYNADATGVTYQRDPLMQDKTDSFEYEICKDAVCRRAIVVVKPKN